MAASMTFMPPGRRMSAVEKLVWAPAPDQSQARIAVTWPALHQSQLTVPVTRHRLRVERDDDAVLLRHPVIIIISWVDKYMYLDYSTGARNEPVEDVPRHPEVVPHVDALGGPHLELPLGGHHLQVSIVCLN